MSAQILEHNPKEQAGFTPENFEAAKRAMPDSVERALPAREDHSPRDSEAGTEVQAASSDAVRQQIQEQAGRQGEAGREKPDVGNPAAKQLLEDVMNGKKSLDEIHVRGMESDLMASVLNSSEKN